MERLDTALVLAQGTYDEFVRCGKKDLAPDINEMKGVIHNLKRKYLNFYDEETKNEIVTEAWLVSVLAKKDKIIEAFTGFNPSKKAQKVKAKDWIALVMRNAVINVSTSYTAKTLETLGKDVGEDFDFGTAGNRDSVSSKVQRYDSEYVEALEGYIVDTRNALATLPEGKVVSKRRLESTLRDLEAKLAEAKDIDKPAPQNDFSEVYDACDGDSWEYDEDNSYEARLVSNMLVRLSAEAQCVFVGLFYGMTPQEAKIALGLNTKGSATIDECLDEIKLSAIDLAKEEEWEYENSSLLDALANYDIATKDSSIKAGLKQSDMLKKFSKCLKEFVDEFGFNTKAEQLKAIAYGKAPKVCVEL